MAEFLWRVRRGSALTHFSDGLVVQGGPRGLLFLSACRTAGRSVSPGAFGLLGPLAAACASEGIRRDTGIISWLHWPDLVTIDGRVVSKTSLSVTPLAEPDQKAQVVFGVTVNCFASRPTSFPSVLPASSILDALGVEIDLNLLRDKILHALDWYFAEWERGVHRKLVDRIRPTIAWLGHDVEVRMADSRVLKGTAEGLDDEGALLLAQRAGRESKKTVALPPESVAFVLAVK